VIAAANRDLEEEVAAGRFRKDLFYRVHGVKVVVPPLRDRREDIPLLLEHFARTLPLPRRFSPAAVEILSSYDWPGNVRELRYAVERAGLLAEHDIIDASDLPPELQPTQPRSAGRAVPDPKPESSREARSMPGAERVRQALEQAKWRRQKAAAILGVSPRTLFRWMQRLGL
jgi:DNA-binding NtrC family response regulator